MARIRLSIGHPLRPLLTACAILAFGLGAGAAHAASTGESIRALDERADGSRVLGLTVHEAPREIPPLTFLDADGNERSLADYQGTVVALHFWATWCFPCRDEIPTVDALQREIGVDRLVVLPLSVDRDGAAIVKAYYRDHDLTTIPVVLDKKMAVARALNVKGIPSTIFLDRDGREIARVLGDRDWADPEVVEIVRHIVE